MTSLPDLPKPGAERWFFTQEQMHAYALAYGDARERVAVEFLRNADPAYLLVSDEELHAAIDGATLESDRKGRESVGDDFDERPKAVTNLLREFEAPNRSASTTLRDLIIAAYIQSLERKRRHEQHPDDIAVDAFAVEMKEKLAAARQKGRGGWENKEECSQADLSRMLREHVEKGDPRDVANFCMFLAMRGERIAAEEQEPVAWRVRVRLKNPEHDWQDWGLATKPRLENAIFEVENVPLFLHPAKEGT